MNIVYRGVLKKSIRIVLSMYTLLFIASCGYKPASHMIQNIFPEAIYVEVKVDKVEPENAPFVKDEMNRFVYTRFKRRVTSKEESKSQIYITYQGSNFTGLAYDDLGYVIRYRANIYVDFKMVTDNGILTKRVSSRHEADIQASSFTSSTLRTEAIRKGLEKALDEFLAYVSVKGILNTEKKQKEIGKKPKSINDIELH